MFCVIDLVRISKTDMPFRKGNKQIFTDKIFVIIAIPTVKLQQFGHFKHFLRKKLV